ncbi:unnamed protein product [Sympodiomycopsis kandeliae]
MAVINLATSISSIPLFTRIFTLLLVLFSLTLFLLRVFATEKELHWLQFSRSDSAIAFPALVIVPGVSFWYPWTLITSAFCETTVIEFVISAISLPLAGRYLERIWGPIELAKFSVIVLVASNVIAWFIALVLFVVLRSEIAFYGTQYHGMEALQTAYLVALAQLIPDHQVKLLGDRLPSIRVRDLPMAYVTFSNITCILGYTSPFILIQFGWLVSWVYLRFYRFNPETGTRGDRSETFTFVSWFPPFLHTPVTHISNFLYRIFTTLKLVPQFNYEYLPTSVSELEMSSDSNTRAEAERRRAMALKALDQRVRVGSSSSSSSSNHTARQPSSATRAQPPPPPPPVVPQPAEVVFEAPTADMSKEVDAEWPSSDEDEQVIKDNSNSNANGSRNGNAAGPKEEDDEGDIGVTKSAT